MSANAASTVSIKPTTVALESLQATSKHTSEFASNLLAGKIATEDAFLKQVKELYPEINYYSGVVEGSPDGTKLSGSEQEQKRTELSMLCLFWLLKGDYNKFTECQSDPKTKLTSQSFDLLAIKTKQLLHTKEALEGMLTTMVIHDLGKIVWFKDAVFKVTAKPTEDHDEVLTHALQQCSHLLPSFQRLSPAYQHMIRSSWEMRLNVGQFTQAENLPANLTNAMAVAKTDPHAFDYFVLHEILDVAGVLGHVKTNGSAILTELVCFAYYSAWNAVSNPKAKNEQEAYDYFLADRGARLGLNVAVPEERALIRLCCIARIFEKNDAETAIVAFKRLPEVAKAILVKELNISGLGEEKGTLLYYGPQIMVNLLQGKSGAQKTDAFYAGLELLARLYQDARIHLASQKGPGVYVMNVAAVAEAVVKDQSALKLKSIEIDFLAAKVSKVVDYPRINPASFSAMKGFTDIPGKRLLFVGIGGGSDGIQAKLLGELATLAGKTIAGIVSIRTKFVTHAAKGIAKGAVRAIVNPTKDLGNGIYQINSQSSGINFDRFLEDAVADENSFMILDQFNEKMKAEQDSILSLKDQLEFLQKTLKADTIIAVDTGGDGLYREEADVKYIAAKTTPDQDLRVLKAMSLLRDVKLLSMEVATGVDAPSYADEVLNKAKAQFLALSNDEAAHILNRYKQLGMDGVSSSGARFGKTALAWQAALGGQATGHHFLPLPIERVIDPKGPWQPVVCVGEAMKGIFVMDLTNHVEAIKSKL